MGDFSVCCKTKDMSGCVGKPFGAGPVHKSGSRRAKVGGGLRRSTSNRSWGLRACFYPNRYGVFRIPGDGARRDRDVVMGLVVSRSSSGDCNRGSLETGVVVNY